LCVVLLSVFPDPIKSMSYPVYLRFCSETLASAMLAHVSLFFSGLYRTFNSGQGGAMGGSPGG
jgi:hypothetical protein